MREIAIVLIISGGVGLTGVVIAWAMHRSRQDIRGGNHPIMRQHDNEDAARVMHNKRLVWRDESGNPRPLDLEDRE